MPKLDLDHITMASDLQRTLDSADDGSNHNSVEETGAHSTRTIRKPMTGH